MVKIVTKTPSTQSIRKFGYYIPSPKGTIINIPVFCPTGVGLCKHGLPLNFLDHDYSDPDVQKIEETILNLLSLTKNFLCKKRGK